MCLLGFYITNDTLSHRDSLPQEDFEKESRTPEGTVKGPRTRYVLERELHVRHGIMYSGVTNLSFYIPGFGTGPFDFDFISPLFYLRHCLFLCTSLCIYPPSGRFIHNWVNCTKVKVLYLLDWVRLVVIFPNDWQKSLFRSLNFSKSVLRES